MTATRPYSSKKEFVYESLMEEIVEGTIEGGSRLVIDDIAQRFGVSHIPVREALQMLSSEGFVTFRPHIGATVTEISFASVSEVFDLLEALEVISGRAACSKINDQQISDLRELLEEIDRSENIVEIWPSKNFAFHEAICEISGYHLSSLLLERIRTHWDRIRRKYLRDVFIPNLQSAQQEHWQMLHALESRDPDTIEKVIRAHNKIARDMYEDKLDQNRSD